MGSTPCVLGSTVCHSWIPKCCGKVALVRCVVGLDGATLKDKGRKIRCYDYVNHPYERVRDALKKNALIVFQTATKTAASRAQSVAAELRVDFVGIGIKTDIKIDLKGIDEKTARSGSTRTTKLTLEW